MLNQHEELEGQLQDLRAWVGNTNLILNSKEYNSGADADSLNQRLQQCEVNSAPILKHLSFELYQFYLYAVETSTYLFWKV